MKLDKTSLQLYVVTDRSWLGTRTLSQQVSEAIEGGATIVQLREKNLTHEQFLEEAHQIKAICRDVPFIINDNLEIAALVEADGVHIGQDDINATIARTRLGANKIIGVSVQTVEQARLAQSQGADYLGVGAVFSTATKQDAVDVSYETLRDICDAVDIPVVAIGGIDVTNIAQLKNSGIVGVAVISSVFAQPDIKKATANLAQLSKTYFKTEV